MIGVYPHFLQFFSIIVTTRLNGKETLDIYNELTVKPQDISRCLEALTLDVGISV